MGIIYVPSLYLCIEVLTPYLREEELVSPITEQYNTDVVVFCFEQ